MKDYLRKMLIVQGWREHLDGSFTKGTGQYSREHEPTEYLGTIQVSEYGLITICDDALGILLGEIEELRAKEGE
jgi:hypothetical protein